MANAVVPSVVSITTTKTVSRRMPIDPLELFFGRRFSDESPAQQKVTSLGSGVIVSKEGHIVTNNHVLNGTDDVTVQLSDGRQSKAKIVGTDGQIDLAVLKIDLENLTPLPIGDSDKVRVGQIVMAIGNPFGLDESVSQGIISAKDRRAMNDSQVEFFQTDTAINPGNSGGPLVNIRGEVIGINTAIYSESGGNQGIGFAIPSNVVRAAMNSIISKGRVIRGYLGVGIQPVTKDIAEQFKLDSARGALVTDVTPGSPAEKAGIIRGDVIRKVNGYEVKDTISLVNRIAEADIGSNLTIDLVRDGETKTVTAKVIEQPADLVARLNRNQNSPDPVRRFAECCFCRNRSAEPDAAAPRRGQRSAECEWGDCDAALIPVRLSPKSSGREMSSSRLIGSRFPASTNFSALSANWTRTGP